VFAIAGALSLLALPANAATVDPCGPTSNPIVCENSKPGTPRADWYTPNAWGSIKGFTAKESVQPGEALQFKVSSPVTYKVSIYRLGWYGGTGARFMPSSPTTAFPAKAQPACLTDTTGLYDCGNWAATASWTVPTDAVSGLYLAMLDQTDGNGVMPYPFVIRNEASHSGIVVQTSDQTWQAYNMEGGRNLYQGNGPAKDGRAYKVSYNRPLDIGGDNGIFGSEFAMIAWLERNGYDVSYLSGIDVSTKGTLLTNHKVYLASGHDEYWNQSQWDNVVAARKAGVNLAFFSGNDVFWRTRLEPAIDGTNAPNRTLVCYKMTKMSQGNGIADPSGTWTGTWMDPNGAGIGGNMPQNQLTGTLFRANGYRNDAMTVPGSYGKLRLWRNTSIANLQPNQTATFPTGTLGYEWNVDEPNSVRPSGAIDMSSTTINITDGTYLLDNGNTYGNGVATHSLVAYRDQVSGALVFSSGTVQWSWGLDTTHVGNATTEDVRMQQATVNLFADMGVQPQTLQSNLVAATKSTDTTGPTSVVTSPAEGATVPALSPVTISGTAADVGGVVARVEVSVDGGSTWQPATGLGSWSFTWTPTAMGSVQMKVRAVDDSVNVGAVTTRSITVGSPQCPCSIFPSSAAPQGVDGGDASAVELGVKFSVSQAGSVTGVRFYKSTLNTGTHIGNLWTSTGQLLATGTFTGESASGWQTLTFSSPAPVKPNTTYIASYYAPNGHYSADSSYFANGGAGLPPIQALASSSSGGNGVYRYATGGGFPSASYNATNYWVDAILDTSKASTTPPTVTAVSPAAAATNVAITAPVTATFDHGIDSSTLAFSVTGPNSTKVSGTVSYDVASHAAKFQPNGQLDLGTTYTASVQASDLWGNAMTSPYTWSFTTSATPPTVTCPCSVWDSTATPANTNPGDPNAIEVGTRFKSAINGYVTGIKFYKGANNTGTHTGSLWSNTGQLLATGTFTGESATGWQTLTFASSVAITANTPYVVSYFAPNGQYGVDSGYFAGSRSNYPLTALADGASGGNGLYRYGTTSGFPTNSYSSSNYWVDVAFTNVAPAAAPVVAAAGSPVTVVPAVAVGGSAITVTMVKQTSVSFSAQVAPESIKITVHAKTPAAEADEGTPVAGSVVYDPKRRTATWRPANPLVPLAKYEVTAQAWDKHGRALKAVVWEVTGPKLRVGGQVPSLPEPRPNHLPVALPPDLTGNQRRNGPVPTDV
jgi:hypothetical protein